MTSLPASSERPEAPLFSDGLGDRVVAVDGATGDLLQILRLRPQLLTVPSFEFALRERAARLANFRHGYYARVRRIDRHGAGLAIVSDHVEGTRLSEILRVASSRHLSLDLNAALCLIRQLVPAVALLHENARDVAHGLIAPERLVVTPHARVALVEHVLGSAVEQLQYTRDRLWQDLRVALPSTAGAPRFDHRADVTATGVIALSLVLGRPLTAEEYPARIPTLLNDARARSAMGEEQPLPPALRAWLARMLQIDARHGFGSATEAQAALEEVLADDTGFVAAPVALETFLSRYIAAVLDPAPALHPVAAPEPRPVSTEPRAVTPEPRPAAVAPVEPAPPARFESVAPAPALVHPSAPAAPQLARVHADPTPAPGYAPAPVVPAAPLVTERPQPVTPRAPVSESEVAAVSAQIDALIAPMTAPAPKPAAPESFAAPAMPSPVSAATPLATPASAATAPGVMTPPDITELLRDFPGVPTEDAEADPVHAPAPRRARVDRKQLMKLGAAVAAVAVLGGGGWVYAARGRKAAGPSTGTLSVQTNPPGVAVFVDGVSRGNTPARISVNAGSHIVELRGRGVPRVIPVQVTAGAEMSQYLEIPETPSTGSLLVQSDPPGAKVTIDGTDHGIAPVSVADLAPGDHEVVLLASGGVPVKQHVVIQAGVTSSVLAPVSTATPGPVSGWISMKAPVSIEIREGGRLIGTTDSDKIMLAAGRHDLQLVNETLGYSANRTVQVPAGKVLPMSVELPQGSINLNATPWAEVWIDGRRVGETPIGNLAIPIGPHEVVFRNPQFGEKHQAVSVTLSAPVRLSIDMK